MNKTKPSSWQASAPSNIALIKYMGKKEGGTNYPLNDSLSYTLENCRTSVELCLTTSHYTKDYWKPLQHADYSYIPNLSLQDQQKFIAHLERLKTYFGVPDISFCVRSANNFPDSCGIASSASSYAALTLCAAQALTEITGCAYPFFDVLADLSRQGSGSSCRSLVRPWALWRAETNRVESPDLPYQELLPTIFIISDKKKQVSSSKAHQRVSTSLLFEGRAIRAQRRLHLLSEAFQNQCWADIFSLVWQDWWDMHSLFETANHPFGYLEAQTLLVTQFFREMWDQKGDGPLITLDAGANVHVLFRTDQEDLKNESQRLLAQQNIKSQ